MNSDRFIRLLPFVAFTMLLGALLMGAPRAEDPSQQKTLGTLVKEWTAILDRTEKSLLKPELADDKVEELRTQVSDLRLVAISKSDETLPLAQQLRDELNTLGEPPAEGAPPESPTVAAKRKVIADQLAATEGSIKEAELVIGRADRILGGLSSLRRTRFTERLMTRGPSPLSPDVWEKALVEIGNDFSAMRQQFEAWKSSEQFAQDAPRFGKHLSIGIVTAFILVWTLRIWLLRKFGYIALEGEPTHAQQLRTALFTGFIRILLPSAAAVAVYLTLTSSGLLSEAGQIIARTALAALIFVFFVAAFCRAALAPFEPEWRIIRITDSGARAISAIVTLLALTFAADYVAEELTDQYGASLELTVVHKFLSGLVIAGLLLILLRPKNWRVEETENGDEPATQLKIWQRMRYLLALLVLAIPATALLGFVALSRVLATQFVLTAGLYVVVVLLRALAAESIEQSLSANTVIGRRLRAGLSLTDDGAEMLRFWVTEATGMVIVLIGFIAFMVLWGAGRHDLSAWLYAAFFGFKLGNISVSLADIFLAGFLLVALLTLTRLLQRTLEHRIFPRTRLDAGIRNSIRSGIGYLGFVIAAGAAVSVIGVDLSNLAIIAGALSVGIGFGLQNIINNFVSGLILLVERPIKVGDRVVVGDHQGQVRKISVRATEVSTSDQASIFIPNSSLISSAVTNRTYADRLGKVQVPIGVAHGTNAASVRDQLLAIAASHPEVKRVPAPVVFFKGFGESTLNFELFATIGDVDKVKAVTSDLCFVIDDAFRKAGIHIPVPQRDVKLELRDEQLERLVTALQGRRPAPSDDTGPTTPPPFADTTRSIPAEPEPEP
ncbi:MAG: mechanosensitive ion channel family protein [Proteobacteria bacterium]|nr:mechanosensitive ion channel family protein [Pseudomonadota bacterium]